MSGLEFAVIVLVATVCAVATVLIVQRIFPDERGSLDTSQAAIAFLFEGNELVHATGMAQSLIEQGTDTKDWSGLCQLLKTRFPALHERLPNMAELPVDVESADADDKGLLRIEQVGNRTRIELLEPESEHLQSFRHAAKSARIQLARMEEMCETSPHPIWRVDTAGSVTWSNDAYRDLARNTDRLDQDDSKPVLVVSRVGNHPRRARASVTLKDGGRAAWYDVTATAIEGGIAYHAANIDAVIDAEIAQRNFVQTLAKTFAQLSTGLAIFDRNGQLALFNPALIDLTGLPAEFLSARPEVMTFFDRLRDRRAMPEPKNYANWRQDIQKMVTAASDGGFQETWTLDSGHTYRVTGRPHPDHAIAFLIEDISAEVSMTRTYRADLDLTRAVLNTLDDALAVFGSDGAMTYCNSAFRTVWKMDPEESFARLTVNDCVRIWDAQTPETVDWEPVRDFVMSVTDKSTLRLNISDHSGTKISVSLTSIGGGVSTVRFSTQPILLDTRQPTG